MTQTWPIMPVGPAEAYKTYQLLQPTATHWRRATCAEVDCRRAKAGWRTVLDVSTVKGRETANWIRLHSGRAFTFVEEGPVVTFTFAGGQRCFEKHMAALGRSPLLRVVGGDFRGNPRHIPTRVMRPADWVDDFGTHQLTIAEAHKRG